METILLIGTNHKYQSLSVRENIRQVALYKKITTSLFPKTISEFVVLLTCSRIEMYTVATNPRHVIDVMKNFFKDSILYIKEDHEAVKHLFEVASGLDSIVPGESEILAQVRDSYSLGVKKKSVGPFLHQLFKESLRIGKQVRHQTSIGTGVISLAHASVLLAKSQDENFSSHNALVIGAGVMGKRVVKNLKQKGLTNIFLMNRTFEKARDLAKKTGTKALKIDELEKALADADLVFCATNSEKAIISSRLLTKVMKQRDNRSLRLFDLALPRDIEESARKVKNVYLFNLDQIQEMVEKNFKSRKSELEKARVIIEKENARFWDWYHTRHSLPVLNALSTQSANILQTELTHTLQKLNHLSDRDKKIIATLGKRLESKLMAKPLTNVKKMAREEGGEELLETVKELFDLRTS